MSAIESETGAATAAPTGAEAPQSRPPESGGPETNSRPAGERRAAPHTRPSAASWSNRGRTGASPTRFAAAHGATSTQRAPARGRPGAPNGGKRDKTSGLPRRAGRPRGGVGGEARVAGTTDGATAIDGGTQPVSRLMVTVMVKPRKLREGVSRHFPHPSCRFGEKPVLKTNGLF